MKAPKKIINILFTALVLSAWFLYSECEVEPNDDGTGSGDDPGGTTNSPPQATIFIMSSPQDDTVKLTATPSTAGSGTISAYEWNLNPPEFSTATLSSTSERDVNFIPDLTGIYYLRLVVFNSNDLSDTAYIEINRDAMEVNAIAGNDTTADIGGIAPLNGSHSTPYFQALNFSWSFIEKPQYSVLTSADIFPPNGYTAAFFMDEPGVYEVELYVEYIYDNTFNDKDTVLLTTNPPEIDSFEPLFGPPGSVVIIYGKNFSSNLLGNTVQFNGTNAIIAEASGSEIKVYVPFGTSNGPVKVIIEETGEEVESEDDFVITTSGWVTALTGIGALYDVDFTDQNNGIAVGVSGSIYTTSDGGVDWDQVSSGTTQGLKGVSYGDANTCYAVGEYGTIIKSTNGGYSWSSLSSGSSAQFTCTFFVDENTGYVAGTSPGIVLYTEDGGISWEDRTPPYSSYNDIFFIDTIGFVVGGAAIFHTENAGISWSNAQSGYYNTNYSGVSFVSAYKGWVVGGPVPTLGESHIAHTTDGGITYTPQPHGVPEALLGVHFMNEYGIVVGENGTILRTTDGGIIWEQETGGDDLRLESVYLLDSEKAIIVGYGSQGGKILRRI